MTLNLVISEDEYPHIFKIYKKDRDKKLEEVFKTGYNIHFPNVQDHNKQIEYHMILKSEFIYKFLSKTIYMESKNIYLNLKNFVGGNSVEENFSFITEQNSKKDQVEAEPVELIKAEPVKEEPVKEEPVKEEPVKAEPVKADEIKKESEDDLKLNESIFDSPEKEEKSQDGAKKMADIIKFLIILSSSDRINPNTINPSFDNSTMHKEIDGKKYKSLKELEEDKLKCLLESCEILWNKSEWKNR